ncbi:glycoside hydrolase family 6 protein [Curtobacterium sp. RRHDQ10]|uniref:glycoside hydrolase family 6 protein n=1 Tax=Curtobacterium phyllosphaerae TaxID=3413379 RepID=UPI003BEF76EB
MASTPHPETGDPTTGDPTTGDPTTGDPTTGGPSVVGARSSARRQWTVMGIVAVLLVAVVVLVLTVVVPGTGGLVSEPSPSRTILPRKTAAAAFPGGLARQPPAQNRPGMQEVAARDRGDTGTADEIARIADQPIATWLTSSSVASTVRTVDAVVANAEQAGKTPVFVLYDIPDRDCGSYSGGGNSMREYIPWVRAVARAMRGSHAVVLVEPDSIAQISNCKRLEHGRIPLLRQAVAALSGHGLTVYLDGGNENRVPVGTMATRLREAGVDDTQGFFTNVSNFYGVDPERSYADELSDRIGGDPHFVIDVSRNGTGWHGTWCNPPGAGLGQTPRVTGGTTRLDALLWVKTPGLSDGTCNGGPAAGQWWESYALDLVANRKQG